MNKCLSSEMPFSLGFSLTLLFLGNNRERESAGCDFFFFGLSGLLELCFVGFFFTKRHSEVGVCYVSTVSSRMFPPLIFNAIVMQAGPVISCCTEAEIQKLH